MRFLFVFLFLISTKVLAENVNTTGAMTFLSLAKKLSPYGSLNFYHYDVFNFEKKSLSSKEFPAGVSVTYFQTSYSYQYLPWLQFSLGHIYQRSNPFTDEYQNENRILEQVVFGMTHKSFTSTHRFRLEERFIQLRDEDRIDFRTRLRYQIGAKLPLRGLNIDANEFYFNTYNEFYFSTTGERNAFFSDDWAYAGLGLKTQSMGSFELGPLVQWSRINQEKDTRTHYTVQIGWILSF